MEPTISGNRMVTSLVVENITNNLNITLIARNEINELRHELFVLYQPPMPLIDEGFAITGRHIKS